MLRKFWESKSGNYAVIFSLAMIPIMVAVAGALDMVSTLNKADHLQSSLDTAALAFAAVYDPAMTSEEFAATGQDFFDANMGGLAQDGEELTFEPNPAEFATPASLLAREHFVRVKSGIKHDGMIRSVDWQAHRESVVKVKFGPPLCVLALAPHAAAAIKLWGSTNIQLEECVIAANSDSSSAVSRGGAALLGAECVHAVGETAGINATSNVELECESALEHQYPTDDPLSRIRPPSYSGCLQVPSGATKTLSPGTYCDQTLSGQITLEPGVYVLRGGQIKLGGGGSMVGSGVTIFLMEDAELSFTANQLIQLSPPTKGPYAGITIYQEKSNAMPMTVTGNSSSEITGFVYAPGAHVVYTGTSVNSSGTCLRLIANTVELTGNSTMTADCNALLGGRSVFASRYLSLVR